ncbi:helix-turn-helix transcriptional regulator [Glutamicibacter sp.]|uniref:helix-turn-helix transcriptional regulator n=1 Tax=Glutamicibacter sp. TaxID=1931995 RepID=UPI002FE2EBB5
MATQHTPRNEQARDFLVTRRAKITPQMAGLELFGGNRRVPGLRREEVAMLAGLSVDYYTRLEKGNLSGVSQSVLEGICRALHLDEAERLYLFDLARQANSAHPSARRHHVSRPVRLNVRPGVQQILDGMTRTPAFVRNGRLDIVATNVLGRALYTPLFNSPTRNSAQALPNMARFRFLDPAAREFYPDFDSSAGDNVKLLRAEGARNPHDPGFTELIGELSTNSEDFRVLWASNDVRLHHSGTKLFHHPVVGQLRLNFEAFDLPGDPGLALTALSAPADSEATQQLDLLASWALSLESSATQGVAGIDLQS